MNGRTTSVAGALGVVAAVVLAWWIGPGLFSAWSVDPVSAERQALVTAFAAGETRPTAARLTGFRYGPLPSAARTVGGRGARPDVRIAAARIEKRASRQISARSGAALGIAYLVTGSLDEAVDILERASQMAPTAASIQSDLAAAYLERGDQFHRAEDVVVALNYSERAVRTDAALTEAWFNRALALERLNLKEQAVIAWQDYSAHDTTSPWAREANERQALAGSASRQSTTWDQARDGIESFEAARVSDGVTRFPQEARDLFERTTLAAWADAHEARDDAGMRLTLGRVRMLAATLERTTGDKLPTEAASALETCALRPRCADRAAVGLRAFRSGRDAYDRRVMANAEREFVAAREALATAGNPMRYWADFYLAGSAFYAKQFADALTSARALAPVARAHRYLNLEARSEWLMGVVPVMQSDLDAGIPHYLRSVELFETTGEVGNQVAILARLGQAYHDAGDLASAWRYQDRAFRIADRSSDRMAVGSLLLASVSFCLAHDLPEAALHFQKAAVNNATTLPAAQRAESTVQLARILSQLGRFDEARAQLVSAGATLDGAAYQDPGRRAEFLLAMGTSLSARDPNQAFIELRQAVDLFSRAGLAARLPEAYLQMGRAAAASGDEGLAISTLLKGLDEFERQRRTLADRAARMLQSANAADLVDELARLYVSTHREWDALQAVERIRARTLVDDLDGTAGRPDVNVESIRHSLPVDTAIVYYATLNDRLFTWAIRHDVTSFAQQAIRRERLAELASRVSAQLSRPETEGQGGPAAELFDILLRPLSGVLAGTRTIVVVPAEPLQRVPFAVLFDARTNQYEVERAAVLEAPSLAVFVHASERLATLDHAGPQSVVVVGDPSRVDLTGRTAVRVLPGAEAEARAVAAQYQASEVLIGRDATKQAFLSSVAHADVVHFGGHAVSGDAGERSRLLFASESAADVTAGDLSAMEIARQHWSRPAVVALAACETAAGRSVRGEGPFSLARAFLFAGVPTVVASLTAADDDSTRRLFVLFHQQLARGEPPERALRFAQRDLLQAFGRGADERWRWAPFVVIGGLSSFQRGL
jgi:CHAT domain-containing protein